MIHAGLLYFGDTLFLRLEYCFQVRYTAAVHESLSDEVLRAHSQRFE